MYGNFHLRLPQIIVVLVHLFVCNGRNQESYGARKRITKINKLPSFAVDNSELFMAAVIERSFDSEVLYLSMMLMGHSVLYRLPQMPFLMINRTFPIVLKWKAASKIWKLNRIVNTHDSGMFCNIRNLNSVRDFSQSDQEKFYTSVAYWAPSRTTHDERFNHGIELLRCKIHPKVVDEWNSVSSKSNAHKLQVEITRGQGNSSNNARRNKTSLISFLVPWKSRQTGYGSNLSKRNSRWDPWQSHLNLETESINAMKQPHAKLKTANRSYLGDPNLSGLRAAKGPIAVMCLSYIRPLEPFRMDPGIAVLIENIEHNILIGFDHIFLSLAVDSTSVHWQRIRLALDSYIRAGQLSLSSMTMPGFDDATGFLGVQIIDDYAKWVHQMQILYLCKGVADFVAFSTSNEFLTVKPPMKSVQEVLLWSGRHLLDSQGRIPCYYVFETLGVPDPASAPNDLGTADNYWAHEFFKPSSPRGPLPGWANIIVPTRNVFLVAHHFCGGCLLSSVNHTTADTDSPSSLRSTNVYSSTSISSQKESRKGRSKDYRDVDEVEMGKFPELDTSIMTHHHTPGDQGILETSHGGMVPPEVATVYYYKGKLDPWHYKRPSYTENKHIELYGPLLKQKLEERGFHFEGTMLVYKAPKSAVLSYYPIYYHNTRHDKQSKLASSASSPSLSSSSLTPVKSSEPAAGPAPASPKAQDRYIYVKLSSERTQSFEARLRYLEPAVRYLPYGKQGLLAEGTWMECNTKFQCKVPIDLIRAA